ncbi:CCL5 protein, partial [Grallaria varia]|nr:CCL5 protein [Grallaria varia]
MKVSTLCLSIILVAALFPQVSPAPLGADTTVCCFNYIPQKVPRAHVKEYFYTSGLCPKPAVVFITQKNREVCANPHDKWVKEYVNSLEMQ